MNSFYDFEAEDARCELHKMEEYRGKVVLVVNTATQCGFTQQYDDLQNIYEKYQEEGLEILDFPCNQFGNQAPGTNEEIVRRYKPFLDELDLTYMFITHDLSVVKHFSNQIMVMYLGQMVEMAPTEVLFKNPVHPYTKALLSAIPIPDPDYPMERIMMKGEITSPIDPEPGCRFAKRCPYATEVCGSPDIHLTEVEPGHFVSCMRIGEFDK